MKSVFAAISMITAVVLASLAGFYVVRTTPEIRLGHWTKATNFFVSTTAAVKGYITGLFKRQNLTPGYEA